VDQRASCSPVPVGERVDRLELGVGDRGLDERGVVVAVDVVQEAWSRSSSSKTIKLEVEVELVKRPA